MHLEPTMFREYDIRGRVAHELNAEGIFVIVRAFATMAHERGVRDVIVGYDGRATSHLFAQEARRALVASGFHVIDIGRVTTPMSYWAQFHFDAPGLVMVTASHNPAEWNGLKLGCSKAQTLLPDEIQELYARVERDTAIDGVGSERTESVAAAYTQDLVSRVRLARPLSVLVNTGNGTAGVIVPDVLRALGCTVIEHLTTLDAAYPNYTPNPESEDMMRDTGAQTVAHRADIGVAFDGDGDRLGVVDERGVTIWADRYLMLLARAILQEGPGEKIVFDVKVSEALPEDIKAHGGVPIMWKTGHSYIKAKLAEEKAALAGEMSGHVFYRDFNGVDDALFATLKLLEYVSEHQGSVSALVAKTPYYVATPTIQVETTDMDKYTIVERVGKAFAQEGRRIVSISGARVYFEDGWGLIRASSNTPTLVLRFEAHTEDALQRIVEEFRGKLRHEGVHEPWEAHIIPQG